LLYSDWLVHWVLRLRPDACESLRLAARAQHICRWVIPRSSYPQTREGYLKWRAELKRFHADKAQSILRAVGYDEPLVGRVRDLILKKLFPQDPEAQVLEDALCLVFLEKQFAALAAKTSREKMVAALRKAWGKMSPAARKLAMTLPYAPAEKALLEEAGTQSPLSAGGGLAGRRNGATVCHESSLEISPMWCKRVFHDFSPSARWRAIAFRSPVEPVGKPRLRGSGGDAL